MDRQFIADIFQAGVIALNDFKGTAAGGMVVSVAAGDAYVPGTTNANQGTYRAFNDAAVTVTHGAADPTNPRVDQVILRIFDSTEVGSGSDLGQVEIVAGTPTAGATLDNRNGAPALPASSIRLVDVLIPAAAASVTTGNMRDRRPWANGARAYLTGTNTSVGSGGIDVTGAAVRLELQSGVLMYRWRNTIFRQNTAITESAPIGIRYAPNGGAFVTKTFAPNTTNGTPFDGATDIWPSQIVTGLAVGTYDIRGWASSFSGSQISGSLELEEQTPLLFNS